MEDIISRQAAIDAVHSTIFDFFDFEICEDDFDSPMTESDKRLLVLNKAITTALRRQPTINPVKHGEWMFEPGMMYCSVCWWMFSYENGLEEEYEYCPHCGARMEERREGKDK